MLVSEAAFEAVGNFTSHRNRSARERGSSRVREGGAAQRRPLQRTLSMLAVATNDPGAATADPDSLGGPSAWAHSAHTVGLGFRVRAAAADPAFPVSR